MRILLAMLGMMAILTSGCATIDKASKGELYPEMYQEMPKTVLVLPAINRSTAADAPHLYSSTVAQPLANAGFYVLSTEVTKKFLENEGLSSGEQLRGIPPQKFGETFGADAVLYVTIEKWDSNYYVLGGNVTVKISYQLKSAKSGSELWAYENEVVLDTSGDSNNSGGLLGAIIATAIKTATQDYVPIARRVNNLALNNIPFGSYHKLYKKDVETLVVVPKNKLGNKNI
ncbi:MAG: hypothetical protein GXP18_00435 [Gammaproteobacteria bacterium]|nr:hypothetical protein [Gammaproteobacteria bacterium]